MSIAEHTTTIEACRFCFMCRHVCTMGVDLGGIEVLYAAEYVDRLMERGPLVRATRVRCRKHSSMAHTWGAATPCMARRGASRAYLPA